MRYLRASREKIGPAAVFLVLSLFLACGMPEAFCASAQDNEREREDASTGRRDEAQVVRWLTSRDPYLRQRAGEELAHRAEPKYRKMLEGYRLQEKDSRVKLAFDWALYRVGKSEALYAVIRDLDSSRSSQAVGYLKHLEGPEPLYKFLPSVNGKTQVKLLEVLAFIGNAETLDQLKPYVTSLDPDVIDAARFADREIKRRLAEQPSTTDSQTRQRQVGTRRSESEP